MSAERKVRQPVQKRAELRRESILDATARILDRDGYDALTTNAVAREAATGIGTVYEYFPSRDALLVGLLARHGARLEARLGALLDEATIADLSATCDRVIDAFAEFWVREPGYRAVWSLSQISAVLRDTGGDWAARHSEKLLATIAIAAPHLAPRERRVIATTIVHLTSSLVHVAIMSGPRRKALLGEAKVALRAYLAARLTPHRT